MALKDKVLSGVTSPNSPSNSGSGSFDGVGFSKYNLTRLKTPPSILGATFSGLYISFFLAHGDIDGVDSRIIDSRTSDNDSFLEMYIRNDIMYLQMRNINDVIVVNVSFDIEEYRYKMTHFLISVSGGGEVTLFIDDTDKTSSITVTVENNLASDNTAYITIGDEYKSSNGVRNLIGYMSHFCIFAGSGLDITQENDRRYFITSDLLPSETILELNPQIYLPLLDNTNMGVNYGSGNADGYSNPSDIDMLLYDTLTDSNYLVTDTSTISDSKQLTFSGQIIQPSPETRSYMINCSNSVWVYVGSDGKINVRLQNNSGDIIVNLRSVVVCNRYNSVYNIQAVVDTADANKSAIIVNGEDVSLETNTIVSDELIDFVDTTSAIGDDFAGDDLPRAFANIFLDNTYVDVRAYNPFINMDTLTHTPLADVITYLGYTPAIAVPLTDPLNVGNNLGYVPDYTEVGSNNGSVTTYKEGYGIWNMEEVEGDFVNSYLPYGRGEKDFLVFSEAGSYASNVHTDFIANKVTFSVRFKTTDSYDFQIIYGAYQGFRIYINQDNIYIAMEGGDYGMVLSDNWYKVLKDNTEYTFNLSIDLDGGTTIKARLNGLDIMDKVYTPSKWVGLDNKNFKITSVVSNEIRGATYDTPIGVSNLYLDSTYIDLDSNNVFYDSETNTTTPVLDVKDVLASTPLVCMPLSSETLGINYGTIGDFTLNGEYSIWYSLNFYNLYSATQLEATDEVNYLVNNSLGLQSSFSSFTAFMVFKAKDTAVAPDETIFTVGGGTADGDVVLGVIADGSEDLELTVGMYSVRHKVYTDLFLEELNNVLFVSYDGTTLKTVVNNVENSFSISHTFTNTTDRSTVFANITPYISSGFFKSNDFEGYVSSIYFTDEYLDISDVNIRDKFVSVLNLPKDLSEQIRIGEIPNPLVYLAFNDINNIGKNNGNGGDYTVVGTVENDSFFNT
jgi:hypothetical protein